MFFVDIERIQFITIITVAAFILVYAKVPPILVLMFVALSWSILYKNNVINESNALFYNIRSQYKQPSIKVAQDNIITAEIITLVNKKNLLSFDVKVIEINNTLLSSLQPKLALKWSNPDYDYPGDIGIGQVWRFKIRLSDTNQPKLLSHHIKFAGIITKGEIIQPKLSLRGDLYQIFKSQLPTNPSPMVYALTFGDRSYITNELWTQLQLLGIGHLVAISGLHIGLIFGFCYFFILGLLRLFKAPYYLVISLTVSLMFAIFYAWVAGFSLPALRAIILLCLHCLYRVQYYKVTLSQLFAMMLLVTLLLDPLAVFSISFWLSFSAMAAVFILVWINKPSNPAGVVRNSVVTNVDRVTEVSKRSLHKVSNLCYSQMLLTVLILPVQLAIFSGFSVLSALNNLVFIPVFSVLILPVLLLAVLLLAIMPELSGILIDNVNDVLNFIQWLWGTLAVNHVIWLEFGDAFDNTFSNSLLLMLVLLIVSFIFKPLRVTFHTLSLLLLPLVCFSYVF